MVKIFTDAEHKKVFDMFKKISETLHLKLLFYKITMIPTQQIALHRLKKIVKKSSSPIKTQDKKKILLFSPGKHGMMAYNESAIAKALQMRGHNMKMVICGGSLSMCTTHFTVTKPYHPWICKNCIYYTKKLFETAGLPYITFKELLTEEEMREIDKKVPSLSVEECEKLIYRNVKVGFHAITSVERYFMGVVPNRQDYEKILRIELKNAMRSTVVAEKLYQNEKPDILITSQGVYSSWGSLTEYFTNKGIRVPLWASGEGNTITFDIHKSKEYFIEYYNEIRKKQPLNSEENKELEGFFNRRIKGEEGQVAFYGFSADTKKEELEKQFQFSKYEKTYVLFPNVPWDAAVLTANIVFKDVYDWIFSTIEIFKEKPKHQLLIKIHPSELKFMESKRTVQDEINEKYSSLPDNIKIIPADTTISPYSLLPNIDVGIVYVGTIGLEMATQNIPVIVAGDAHYMNNGFTYDIKSREDYSKFLQKDLKPLSNQQDIANIYSYFHFIKKFMPRTYIYHNNFLNIGWNIKSLEEFKPGQNKYLDHICNYIINDGVYQNW
jgi:hypothetical protein